MPTTVGRQDILGEGVADVVHAAQHVAVNMIKLVNITSIWYIELRSESYPSNRSEMQRNIFPAFSFSLSSNCSCCCLPPRPLRADDSSATRCALPPLYQATVGSRRKGSITLSRGSSLSLKAKP